MWRRRGEHYADCCTDRVIAFVGGSMMVWDGIALTGKTRLVITGGNLSAGRYWAEILQPIPYLHSEGKKLRHYFQNLGLERIEWPTCSPELNPTEHLWDQLGRAVHSRVTNITTLAVLRQTLVQEWDAIARQCVTKVVTSMRRRCLAVVNVYDSSTCYWDPSLLH